MKNKICFIYPWATLGGVERVLINRAKAFAYANIDVAMSVYFLHDSGGLDAFKNTLAREGLKDHCQVITRLNNHYDFMIPIDTEDGIKLALKSNSRILFECHTSYKKNRNYLRSIHHRCEAIIVPSEQFKEEITEEINRADIQCYVLNNFVPWDLEEQKDDEVIELPDWTGIPVLFLGRLDTLKNYAEFISAMSIVHKKNPGKFFPIICGPVSSNTNIIQILKRSGLFGKALYLPAIPFGSVKTLLKAMANKKGIFVSTSKAESFGLSAAEALSYGIPTLLSNIPAHLELVKPYEAMFTYPLGNVVALINQLNMIANNYDWAVSKGHSVKQRFASDRFITEWEKLMMSLEEK